MLAASGSLQSAGVLANLNIGGQLHIQCIPNKLQCSVEFDHRVWEGIISTYSPLHSPCICLPAVMAVQGDCERVYHKSKLVTTLQ